MKKFNLFSSAMVAALMLASCSANDDLVNGGQTGNSENNHYLAVNIVDVDGSATRAGETSKEDFVYGSEDENTVKNLRFYLFDSNDKPFYFNTVQGNSVNFANASVTDANPSNDNNDPNNVEKIKQAVIVINGSVQSTPAKIIAIANYNELNLDDNYKTIDDLKKLSANLSTTPSSVNGFLMSSTTYEDNGQVVLGAAVTSANIGTTPEEAKSAEKAVTVHIERALAKVDPELGTENYDNDGFYKGKSQIDKASDGVVGQIYLDNKLTDIYVKISGAVVADEANESFALKSLDASYTLGFTPWSEATRYRSYWANSVENAGGKQNQYYWSNIDKNGFSAVYTQENTPTSVVGAKDGNLTKLLVAGQLHVKGDNNTYTPQDLYQYLGAYYSSVDDLADFLLKTYGKTYKKKGTDGNATDLEREDIVLGERIGQYKVGLTLKEGTEILKEGQDATSELKEMLAKEQVKHWKDGKCYYYTAVRHLGTNAEQLGYYGIVRNHVYQLTLGTIKGLGTPVPEPDQPENPDPENPPIDPEDPDETDSYLAAQCKILSWRIVKNTVNFE